MKGGGMKGGGMKGGAVASGGKNGGDMTFGAGRAAWLRRRSRGRASRAASIRWRLRSR
jgi:hypothetical protein